MAVPTVVDAQSAGDGPGTHSLSRALRGYGKLAGADGTVSYGARAGIKLSRNEETSLFLEALYLGFSEAAFAGSEGLQLRIGTNIYPR